jgi:hypothetical protein
MRVGGQRHTPAALPPGMTRYPLYRRLGGPQSRYGNVRKISPPPGFEPRTVQPVASRYADCTIPAHTAALISTKNSHNDKRLTQTHKNCVLTKCVVSRKLVVMISVFSWLLVCCINWYLTKRAYRILKQVSFPWCFSPNSLSIFLHHAYHMPCQRRINIT